MGSARWWTFIAAVVLFGFAAARCSTSQGVGVSDQPVNSAGAIDPCGDGGFCCDAGSCWDAGSCCDAGDCCDAQSLEIISLDEEGVVSTSQTALILANLLPRRVYRDEEQVQIYAIRASDGALIDIAEGDHPDGDLIVPDSYEWYAGDGSAPEFGTHTYEHTYPSDLSEAEVAVSVFD